MRDICPKRSRGLTSFRPQGRCYELSRRRGALGLQRPGLPRGGGGRGCSHCSSHSQGPLLGPRCPERGPLCPTLWEAPAGAWSCRQAGVNGTLLLSACPGPTPLAESSQVTFEGAAAALGGSPKASGLLLAFSCPLARPAWAWPERGLTSAWPRKVAQPANLCLRVQNHRTRTAAHTRILARPQRLSTGNKGQGRSVCLEALHPACPIDSQGCPASEPPPVAGLSPGRSQRGWGLDPTV